MLETIREFAAERLETRERPKPYARGTRSIFWPSPSDQRKLLRGGEQKAWLHRMFTEEGNIRDALTWAVDGGHAEIALRFAFALEVFWVRAIRWTEASRWLELILRFDDPPRPILRARALGYRRDLRGHPRGRRTPVRRERPRASQARGRGGARVCPAGTRVAAPRARRVRRGSRCTRGGGEGLFARLGHAVATRFVDLGTIAMHEGDHVGARRWFERALSAARGEGDAMGASDALQALGDLDLSTEGFDPSGGQVPRRPQDRRRVGGRVGRRIGARSCGGGGASRGLRTGQRRLWRIAERLADESEPPSWPEVQRAGPATGRVPRGCGSSILRLEAGTPPKRCRWTPSSYRSRRGRVTPG